MQPTTPQPRPELKIYGDNITFEFPQAEKPADVVHGELIWSVVRTLAMVGVGSTCIAFLFLMPGGVPNFPQAEMLICGAGAFLFLMAFLTAARGIFIYRRWHQEIDSALARIVTELSVEDGRLIRRYASGREEVWPHDAIHDVVVEERHQFISPEDEETRVVVHCVLCMVLASGQRVDLLDPAPGRTRQEQDLHWMAKELRQSLHVPHGEAPSPVEDVKLARTADGITIDVPHKDPLAVWRAYIHGFLAMGVSIGGFLYLATGIVFLAGWHEKGLEGIDWHAVTVISLVGSTFVAIACIGILWQLLGKKWIVRDIRDQTAAWVGVRGDQLFRRYLSGREETWAARDIVEVFADMTAQNVKVQVRFKQGAVVHLYGDMHIHSSQPRERESLAWIADKLNKALRPDSTATAPSPIPGSSTAIIDLATPQPDHDKYKAQP